MPRQFRIGDKVDPLHSNHQEGTVIAIFTGSGGEPRYAVEMAGHHSIQLVTGDRLSPYRSGE